MKTQPSRMERPKSRPVRLFFPLTMASSPMATVKELVTSTKVLTPPIQVSRPREACEKASV